MVRGKPKMEESIAGKRVHMAPLPPYEGMLLANLAFFLQRKPSTQAANCLSMYLRQSESRIRKHAEFYAKQAAMDVDELMNVVYRDPKRANEILGAWWEAAPDDEARDFDYGEET